MDVILGIIGVDMKLKFITDKDKGIEFEANYFTGHFEQNNEAIFSFTVS